MSCLRQRDAQLLRHQPHGFGECDVLDFLHEAEDVAGNTATEAVIELARGVYRERWCLLAVEGAKPGIVLRSRLLQLNVVADDADDIGLLLDGVREVAGVGHETERLVRRNCPLERLRGEYTNCCLIAEKLWNLE